MGPSGRFTHGLLYWIVGTGYIQVIYRLCTKGRAPFTKETLPDFQVRYRVTRHSRAFCGLTGSQWTPGIWAVTFRNQVVVVLLPTWVCIW